MICPSFQFEFVCCAAGQCRGDLRAAIYGTLRICAMNSARVHMWQSKVCGQVLTTGSCLPNNSKGVNWQCVDAFISLFWGV